MHCPQCGQHQISEETRFCSRCGFHLAAIAAVLATDGVPQADPPGITGSAASPRRRGFKKGLFTFLLTFLVVPIVVILSIWLRAGPFFVAISAVGLFMGGLLRMVYALMFESAEPVGLTLQENLAAASKRFIGSNKAKAELPPGRSVSASDYVSPRPGSWLDTNDLQPQPGSVIDSTTKLLERESDNQ